MFEGERKGEEGMLNGIEVASEGVGIKGEVGVAAAVDAEALVGVSSQAEGCTARWTLCTPSVG